MNKNGRYLFALPGKKNARFDRGASEKLYNGFALHCTLPCTSLTVKKASYILGVFVNGFPTSAHGTKRQAFDLPSNLYSLWAGSTLQVLVHSSSSRRYGQSVSSSRDISLSGLRTTNMEKQKRTKKNHTATDGASVLLSFCGIGTPRSFPFHLLLSVTILIFLSFFLSERQDISAFRVRARETSHERMNHGKEKNNGKNFTSDRLETDRTGFLVYFVFLFLPLI